MCMQKGLSRQLLHQVNIFGEKVSEIRNVQHRPRGNGQNDLRITGKSAFPQIPTPTVEPLTVKINNTLLDKVWD